MRAGHGNERRERGNGAARRHGGRPRPGDLYELVGHDLAGIARQSELAEALVPAAPERAAAAMRTVGDVARTALRAVRAAVVDDGWPTLVGELRGARDILDAAGIAYRQEGAGVSLSPTIEAALAGVVREGVANVVMHSGARRCTVRVTCAGGQAVIEVLDDGAGAVVAAGGGGRGLPRLTARVAALGGWCDVGPRPGGGFRLAVALPVETAAGAVDGLVRDRS